MIKNKTVFNLNHNKYDRLFTLFLFYSDIMNIWTHNVMTDRLYKIDFV